MLAGKKTKTQKLPEDFKETQWLEGTGTQYINTEELTSNNIKVIAVAINTFGSTDSSGNKFSRFLFGARYSVYDSNFTYFGGQTKDIIGTGDGNRQLTKITTTEPLRIQYDNSSIIINCGDDYSVVNKSLDIQITNPYPIFIFTINEQGSPRTPIGSWKVISFMIIKNNVLVRNFVPCYRKSDNKPGLYDLCGSTCSLTNSPFYVNAGTGEFINGPEVSE